MKKIGIFIVFSLFILILSGCTFNKLGREKQIVYENENKTVRLEIGFKTSDTGKLYIEKDNIKYSFVVRYFIVRIRMIVYIDFPKSQENIIFLKVGFGSNKFIGVDWDTMYLINERDEFNNPSNEIFDNFNVKLTRKYDKKINPLNYFRVEWINLENKIKFINRDLKDFYFQIMRGKLNEEIVFIKFNENNFIIRDYDDNIKMSGKYKIKDLNIILNPLEIYTNYPKEIVLEFR